jgi:tetratricopeptide (TPR) repeat protein
LSPCKELGLLYYRLEHFADAQRSLERALALQPHDPELYQALAENVLKLKASDQGLAYQKKALEFSRPEAVARRQEKLGVMALQLGRAQEVADYFQPAQAAGRDRWEMNSRALSTRMRSGSPYWATARFRVEATSSMTNWKRFSRLAVPAARPSEPATTRINK